MAEKLIELDSKKVLVRLGKDALMEPSVAGRIFFSANSNKELSYNDILAVQEKCGYHYMGYDYPKSLEKRKGNDGNYYYRWSCSACCS